MKRRFAAAVIFCLSAAPLAHAETIRVRLTPPQAEVTLSGFGLRLGPETALQSLSALPRHNEARVRVNGGVWQVQTADGATMKFQSSRLYLEGEMLRLAGEAIPGNVILHAVNNRIEPVAELDLDLYLRGVVPSEMPIHWPLEALKAQAVAARSYALHLMREREGRRYHVESGTNHQVFKLMNFTGANGGQRDRILRAVEETRGQVLTDKASSPYKAHYHAHCGGHTESAAEVWGGESEAPAKPVKDESCARVLSGRWTAKLSESELAARLLGERRPTSPLQIVVAEHSPSGRVARLRIIAGDQETSLSSQRFRELLGYNVINSTFFEFERRADATYFFKGRGHGHGVGMCQWGARWMAQAGASYREILARYYPQARLKEPLPRLGMNP